MICVHMHIRDASGDLRSELQNERKLQLMRSELERFVTFFFLRLPTTVLYEVFLFSETFLLHFAFEFFSRFWTCIFRSFLQILFHCSAFCCFCRVHVVEQVLSEYNNLKKLNDFLEGPVPFQFDTYSI